MVFRMNYKHKSSALLSSRAKWIAKSLLAAALPMPWLTLKLHAQPGLCLHHSHQ